MRNQRQTKIPAWRKDYAKNHNLVYEYNKKYPLATIAEIAKGTGLNKATVYRHLPQRGVFEFPPEHPLIKKRDQVLEQLSRGDTKTNTAALKLYLQIVSGFTEKTELEVKAEIKTLGDAITSLQKKNANKGTEGIGDA